jgi:uncharacterized protein YbjT (DUF2867 family)
MSDKKIIAVFGATGAQGGGLARAIAADRAGPFTARAITRHPDSAKAKALTALGVEVVAADTDDAASLAPALAGAHSAFCVTNFWEHFSAEREGVQAAAMARATKQAGIKHVVWSTLEDTRKWVPLADSRLPTLQGKYKCPHFDSKGAMDAVFANEAAPTTYMMAAFYWENFIHFGMGPRVGDDGNLVLAMPLGGVKLPGIGAEDIGRCAYGIFKKGESTVGQRIGIAGESLTGADMAAKMGRALGKTVNFFDMPFDIYRGLGFPGAEDLGNMFQFQAILGEEFQGYRDVKQSRALNPALLDFDGWLAANAAKISIPPAA